MNNNSTFAYVHTESGPVKPAKAVPIETMKNIVASIQGKHVRGEKGVNWGDLAKKVNKDCNPHGYTTIQTILNKALTEAVAQSVGQSLFRLDLGNVVCDSAHAKFKMSRKNHSVVVDMLYPNDNGNITIKYNVDDFVEKMFELSLDSEHYIDGFGQTILQCCDDAIKEANEMAEEDNIYSTDENGYQPIMDADMRGLLNIANAIMESDMGGADGGFGEADFAAPADNGTGMAPGMPGGMGGDAAGGATGGNAGLGGDLEGPNKEVNFVDYCLDKLSTTVSQDSSQNGSFTRLTNILADKMSNEARKNHQGMMPTGKQICKGTQGIMTDWSPVRKLEEFQTFYKQFKGMVYQKEAEAFCRFLESNDVNSALEFESWLYSDKMMQEMAARKGEGRETTNSEENMDSGMGLPNDGTAATGMGGAGAGGMDAGMSGMDAGMTGMDDGTGGLDTGMAGADLGAGADIKDIGQLDQISENTSEELPNLGGNSDTNQTDENQPF